MIGGATLFRIPAMLQTVIPGGIVMLGPLTAEAEDQTASITTHAVEDGSNISDHVHAQPISLAVKTLLVDKQPTAILSALRTISIGPESVAEKKAILEKWKREGELLIYSGPVQDNLIVTSYDTTIMNMAIKRLAFKRRGNGLEVDIGLQQLNLATFKVVETPKPPATKQVQNAGQQATETVGADKGSSALFKLAGGK